VQKLLGYSPDSWLGCTGLDYVHPEDQPACRSGFLSTFHGCDASIVRHRLRHADGSWRWFESTGRAYEAAGSMRFVCISRDVTERLRMEEAIATQLATERRIAADRILGHPFILPPEGSATREALDRVFEREAGRAPVGTVETSSYAIIKRLLAQSQHVSFRSTKEFREEVAAGEVAALDLGFGIEGRMICILQRAGAIRTPAIAAVLALVRDAARGT
jgi:PAS domain S-box-containing protein